MIADLKPYPAYKDSGISWLGKVPGHWQMRRLDKLFELRNETPLDRACRRKEGFSIEKPPLSQV